jgi:hypothetical protein
MNSQTVDATRCRVPEDPQVLQETIVLMESRLRSLGDGDCAYEKAMIRFYEEQLVLHRARFALQAGVALD